MQKVLIVDDEQSIRTGLSHIIDWQDYGCTIIGAAENGEIGLEMIRELNPDVVITDIQMPGKTGLEMIQDAVSEGLSFYPIILSGYSDFEYAKEAMKLGAVSYQLKPVDEDELIENLENIMTKMKDNKEKNLKSQLMEKLFGGDDTGIKDYKFVKTLRVKEEHDADVLTAFLSEKGMYVVPMVHRHNRYVVLMSDEKILPTQLDMWCEEILPNREILSSHWVSGGENLKIIAKDIQDLHKMTYFLPKQLISHHILEIEKENKISEDASQQLLDKLLASEELGDHIDEYFSYYQLTSEEDVKWRINSGMNWLVEQIHQKVDIRIDCDMDKLHQDIYASENYLLLKQLIHQKLSEIEAYLAGKLNNVDIISEMKQYTKKNYQKDLSLKNIGEHFNYNSAYLGKKFRKETGITYLAFLEEVRMEKAVDILKNSQLMVYEVAEKVGYSNVDYFYKKFKQYFNISPNEYRKN